MPRKKNRLIGQVNYDIQYNVLKLIAREYWNLVAKNTRKGRDLLRKYCQII